MNIFKVIASGKKTFNEETASAILSWFMNPFMEHGLGFSFLKTFIKKLSSTMGDTNVLDDLNDSLTPRMRTEDGTQSKLWSNLEYKVEQAYIDIVIGIEGWVLAIENKIYPESVSSGQLKREYEGLKKKNPKEKIGLIYLVPIEEKADLLDPGVAKEFGELTVQSNDFKSIVTWQKNNIDDPMPIVSIAEVIGQILDDESKGVIDPIPEYIRHTLKALNAFISNKFEGYDYERSPLSTGINPLTEEQLTIKELASRTNGYVGVKGGIKGILTMDNNRTKQHKFQYSSQDMSHLPNWISLPEFNNIIRWKLDKVVKGINWKGRLPARLLYEIAKDYKENVCIGIKGGEKALGSMDAETIKSKEWNIITEQSKNPQWINGIVFDRILDEKGVF